MRDTLTENDRVGPDVFMRQFSTGGGATAGELMDRARRSRVIASGCA